MATEIVDSKESLLKVYFLVGIQYCFTRLLQAVQQKNIFSPCEVCLPYNPWSLFYYYTTFQISPLEQLHFHRVNL